MVIFNFKPNSFLNTTWARVVNGVILFLLVSLISSTTFRIKSDINGGYILIAAILWVILVCFSTGHVLASNTWFELDKIEAKNKESFILIYCMLASIFVMLMAISILSAIMIYERGGFGVWIYILLAIYFTFNWMNICSLFNFNGNFDRLLPQYIDTSTLPAKEALKKDREILKYVLEKEYKIDLEKVMDSAWENGWHNFLNREW